MQGLLTGARLSVQAELSCRTAHDRDNRERSAVTWWPGERWSASCQPLVKYRSTILTLVAVWRAEDRLMAVADTRIVRSPGNVLTEHGPKLLPLVVVCKQPGASGFFDREAYRAEIGFAYSGSTLSARAAHALSN